MIWDTLVETAKNKAGDYLLDFATKKKNWEFITQFFSKKEKKRKIIILGASGVGKSQFVQSLQSDVPQVAIQKRTMGTVEKEATLQGQGIVLLDTTGQSDSKSQLIEFRKTTRDDEYVGVINVVNYGYNYLSTINPEKDVFEGDIVKNEFLQNNKEQEIVDVQKWLPHLEDSNVKWIITLVNKADIWWKERGEILKYYESKEGEYGKVFETHFQTNYFKKIHLVLPYSSILEPFYDKFLISLGDTAKSNLQNHFISELARLIQEQK